MRMSLPEKRVPIVTFDLGGVIVQVCPTPQMAAERAGVPRPPIAQPKGVQRLLSEWQVGRLSDDSFFSAWARAHGGQISAEETKEIFTSMLMGEFNGIYDIIKKLIHNKIRLACLSNTCRHHWNLMVDFPDHYPSINLIRERFGSHMLGHMKPEAAIFHRFERAIGASGADIVYFDDALENVDAALNRGWQAFQILPHTPPSEQILNTLVELSML